MTEMIKGAVNSLCISSMANKTPVRGAWKAADMPAAAPQVTSSRSSPLLRPRALETALPDMPPSWTLGPSRPSERPPSAHSVPSMNFANMTRCQGMSILPATSASTCGIPEPDVAGSHNMSLQTTQSSAARNANHASMGSGFPAIALVTERKVFSAPDNESRYSVMTAPAARPTKAPSPTRFTWNRRERCLETILSVRLRMTD